MSTRDIVPRNNNEGGLGIDGLQWGSGHFGSLYLNGSGLESLLNSKLDNSGIYVSVDEINYLSGVTDNIQIQIDSKLNSGIRLDELDEPTDNTNLNATTGRHGLLPKLNNTGDYYLNGSGYWSSPFKYRGTGESNILEKLSLVRASTLSPTYSNLTYDPYIGEWFNSYWVNPASTFWVSSLTGPDPLLNRVNLGTLSNGILKISVSGGFATPSIAASGVDYIVGGDSRLSNARIPSGNASGDLRGTYPNPSVVKISPSPYSVGGIDILNNSGSYNITPDSGRHQVINTNEGDVFLNLPNITSGIATGTQVYPGWSILIENDGVNGNDIITYNSLGIEQGRVGNGDELRLTAIEGDVWRASLNPSNQPFIKSVYGINLSSTGDSTFNLFRVPSGINYIPTDAKLVISNYGGGNNPEIQLVESFATGLISPNIELTQTEVNTVINLPISGEFPIVGGGNYIQLKMNQANTGTLFLVNVHLNGYYIV